MVALLIARVVCDTEAWERRDTAVGQGRRGLAERMMVSV